MSRATISGPLSETRVVTGYLESSARGAERAVGLGEHVRRVVAQHFEAIGAVSRDEFEFRVAFERARCVPPFSVDLGGDDFLGQPF